VFGIKIAMKAEGIRHEDGFESASDAMVLAPLLSAPLLDLPYSFAKTNGLVILQLDERRLTIAVRDDADPAILLEVSNMVTLPIDLEFASALRFNSYLSAHYKEEAVSEFTSLSDNTINGSGAISSGAEKVFQLIGAMIFDAAKHSVSGIHIEAYNSQLIVRVRRDGKLHEQFRLSPEFSKGLASQLNDRTKIGRSGPNATQKGKICFVTGDKEMEISISAMAGKDGERIVLRIPNAVKTDVVLDLPGMSSEVQLRLKHVMAESGGMIIVAGPKDSGITTTLYAALNQLNDGNRNIMTIENFIECNIDGINQLQFEETGGAPVAEMLRAVLLQDPDVVMLSELSDRKTVEIALRAALHGPLVLTALHTEDSIGVIAALRELKVDRTLVGESLRAIIAQRLVNRLCPDCRVPAQAAGSIASRLGFDRGTGIFEPKGCAACDFTGFSGSVGVFEVVCIDDTMRRLINNGGDETVISNYAFMNNPNLSSAARKLVISGETTAEEAIRIGHR
jgi:general secretion pathway protein E